MPRKETRLPGKDVQNMDALVVQQEQSLQQREAEIQRIEALFQFEEPYERLSEESRLDFYHVQKLNASFEQGKSLLRMRAHEGRGGLEMIIENHHLPRREAFYDMAIAEKIAPYQKQFEGIGKRNLQLLSSLDEKDIKTLAEGGEVAGISLDKPMTYKELAAALQEANKKREEKVDALEAVINQKTKKINELEQQLRYQEPPTKEQLAVAALRQYRDPIIDNLLEATERINRATAAIDEAQKIPHIPFEALEKLIEPWKGCFETFLEAAEDFSDAFNNIHVDKGRG